jgi:hypothetical protein
VKNKFENEDQRYLANRAQFAKNLGWPDLFSFIDQFGVYAGGQTLGARLFAYEALKRTLNIPGHIIEFGVWHGSNLLFMAKLLKMFSPNTHKQVIGFDNFAGLPSPADVDGDFAKDAVGKYKGNLETLRAAIDLYELDGWVELVIGDANQTIPEFEKDRPESLVSLAYIDFDLYEPCATALKFLSNRLTVGGVIVFDEAVCRNFPGETVALLEFLETHPGQFRMEANTLSRQPTLLLVREK